MIVCGTGHRPNKLGGYSNFIFNKLVTIAEEWILENTPDRVISGVALGWDQALAQAALNNNIPLTSAIPFKGQEKNWPEESQKKYKEIITKSDKVHIVCSGSYENWKMQKRNEWMADNSDLVLAMWDGSNGGTGKCIKYAEKKNKLIVNLFGELI